MISTDKEILIALKQGIVVIKPGGWKRLVTNSYDVYPDEYFMV